MKKKRLNHFLGLLVLLLIGLIAYSWGMAAVGGFSAYHLYYQWLEFVLLAYLYLLVYSICKPGYLRSLYAALPILLLYLIHDVFYLVYGKVFRFINFSEVPELLQILSPLMMLLLLIVFIAPAIWLLLRINYRRPWRLLLAVLPMMVIFTFLHMQPTAVAASIKSMTHEIVKYSDGKSVENNGRLAMMLYREAQRIDTLDKIGPYRNRVKYEERITQRIATLKQHLVARNVHLIVLESFLDPRLFKKLKFSRPPVHPDFESLFTNKLSLSYSPVFGGATAQAEFEVLCGVPAFEQLSSVEFNVFSGSAAHCLPGQLAALSYQSVATNAYKPNFFNAIAGYKGMGFQELNFPQEFYSATPSYLKFGDPGVEEYLFDKDLLSQNLEYVRTYLSKKEKTPLFNYVMTIYGHTPHILDPEKRPEIINTLSAYADDHLQRATNQFYYRSQAIAEYVRKLIALDDTSIIILVSDHVPPLRNGPNTYNALEYMQNQQQSLYLNRLMVIEHGQAKKVTTIHHYELPEIILNYLTDGHYCRVNKCAHLGETTPGREARREAYLTLMAHASE